MEWSLAEARRNFDKMVKQALEEGPQHVTDKGRPLVIVLSSAEFDCLSAAFRQSGSPENGDPSTVEYSIEPRFDSPIEPSEKAALLTPGRSVAGIDGCKAGWVVVRRDENGQFEPPVAVATLDGLPPANLAVIDIPIGLPDSGRRACDLAARERLRAPRCHSVFLDVRRPLLKMASYEAANAWGKRDGAGISPFMWGILPKIREVDDWITPARNRSFREGHPELSFAAAAGQPMAHYKKKPVGESERLKALAGFVDPAMVREWLDNARGSGAARDDIVDALALCRTAARVVLGCHGRLPGDPPTDARGLPMEMVF